MLSFTPLEMPADIGDLRLQVRAFLDGVVAPIRERYAGVLGDSAELKV